MIIRSNVTKTSNVDASTITFDQSVIGNVDIDFKANIVWTDLVPNTRYKVYDGNINIYQNDILTSTRPYQFPNDVNYFKTTSDQVRLNLDQSYTQFKLGNGKTGNMSMILPNFQSSIIFYASTDRSKRYNAILRFYDDSNHLMDSSVSFPINVTYDFTNNAYNTSSLRELRVDTTRSFFESQKLRFSYFNVTDSVDVTKPLTGFDYDDDIYENLAFKILPDSTSEDIPAHTIYLPTHMTMSGNTAHSVTIQLTDVDYDRSTHYYWQNILVDDNVDFWDNYKANIYYNSKNSAGVSSHVYQEHFFQESPLSSHVFTFDQLFPDQTYTFQFQTFDNYENAVDRSAVRYNLSFYPQASTQSSASPFSSTFSTTTGRANPSMNLGTINTYLLNDAGDMYVELSNISLTTAANADMVFTLKLYGNVTLDGSSYTLYPANTSSQTANTDFSRSFVIPNKYFGQHQIVANLEYDPTNWTTLGYIRPSSGFNPLVKDSTGNEASFNLNTLTHFSFTPPKTSNWDTLVNKRIFNADSFTLYIKEPFTHPSPNITDSYTIQANLNGTVSDYPFTSNDFANVSINGDQRYVLYTTTGLCPDRYYTLTLTDFRHNVVNSNILFDDMSNIGTTFTTLNDNVRLDMELDNAIEYRIVDNNGTYVLFVSGNVELTSLATTQDYQLLVTLNKYGEDEVDGSRLDTIATYNYANVSTEFITSTRVQSDLQLTPENGSITKGFYQIVFTFTNSTYDVPVKDSEGNRLVQEYESVFVVNSVQGPDFIFTSDVNSIDVTIDYDPPFTDDVSKNYKMIVGYKLPYNNTYEIAQEYIRTSYENHQFTPFSVTNLIPNTRYDFKVTEFIHYAGISQSSIPFQPFEEKEMATNSDQVSVSYTLTKSLLNDAGEANVTLTGFHFDTLSTTNAYDMELSLDGNVYSFTNIHTFANGNNLRLASSSFNPRVSTINMFTNYTGTLLFKNTTHNVYAINSLDDESNVSNIVGIFAHPGLNTPTFIVSANYDTVYSSWDAFTPNLTLNSTNYRFTLRLLEGTTELDNVSDNINGFTNSVVMNTTLVPDTEYTVQLASFQHLYANLEPSGIVTDTSNLLYSANVTTQDDNVFANVLGHTRVLLNNQARYTFRMDYLLETDASFINYKLFLTLNNDPINDQHEIDVSNNNTSASVDITPKTNLNYFEDLTANIQYHYKDAGVTKGFNTFTLPGASPFPAPGIIREGNVSFDSVTVYLDNFTVVPNITDSYSANFAVTETGRSALPVYRVTPYVDSITMNTHDFFVISGLSANTEYTIDLVDFVHSSGIIRFDSTSTTPLVSNTDELTALPSPTFYISNIDQTSITLRMDDYTLLIPVNPDEFQIVVAVEKDTIELTNIEFNTSSGLIGTLSHTFDNLYPGNEYTLRVVQFVPTDTSVETDTNLFRLDNISTLEYPTPSFDADVTARLVNDAGELMVIFSNVETNNLDLYDTVIAFRNDPTPSLFEFTQETTLEHVRYMELQPALFETPLNVHLNYDVYAMFKEPGTDRYVIDSSGANVETFLGSLDPGPDAYEAPRTLEVSSKSPTSVTVNVPDYTHVVPELADQYTLEIQSFTPSEPLQSNVFNSVDTGNFGSFEIGDLVPNRNYEFKISSFTYATGSLLFDGFPANVVDFTLSDNVSASFDRIETQMTYDGKIANVTFVDFSFYTEAVTKAYDMIIKSEGTGFPVDSATVSNVHDYLSTTGDVTIDLNDFDYFSNLDITFEFKNTTDDVDVTYDSDSSNIVSLDFVANAADPFDPPSIIREIIGKTTATSFTIYLDGYTPHPSLTQNFEANLSINGFDQDYANVWDTMSNASDGWLTFTGLIPNTLYTVALTRFVNEHQNIPFNTPIANIDITTLSDEVTFTLDDTSARTTMVDSKDAFIRTLTANVSFDSSVSLDYKVHLFDSGGTLLADSNIESNVVTFTLNKLDYFSDHNLSANVYNDTDDVYPSGQTPISFTLSAAPGILVPTPTLASTTQIDYANVQMYYLPTEKTNINAIAPFLLESGSSNRFNANIAARNVTHGTVYTPVFDRTYGELLQNDASMIFTLSGLRPNTNYDIFVNELELVGSNIEYAVPGNALTVTTLPDTSAITSADDTRTWDSATSTTLTLSNIDFNRLTSYTDYNLEIRVRQDNVQKASKNVTDFYLVSGNQLVSTASVTGDFNYHEDANVEFVYNGSHVSYLNFLGSPPFEANLELFQVKNGSVGVESFTIEMKNASGFPSTISASENLRIQLKYGIILTDMKTANVDTQYFFISDGAATPLEITLNELVPNRQYYVLFTNAFAQTAGARLQLAAPYDGTQYTRFFTANTAPDTAVATVTDITRTLLDINGGSRITLSNGGSNIWTSSTSYSYTMHVKFIETPDEYEYPIDDIQAKTGSVSFDAPDVKFFTQYTTQFSYQYKNFDDEYVTDSVDPFDYKITPGPGMDAEPALDIPLSFTATHSTNSITIGSFSISGLPDNSKVSSFNVYAYANYGTGSQTQYGLLTFTNKTVSQLNLLGTSDRTLTSIPQDIQINLVVQNFFYHIVELEFKPSKDVANVTIPVSTDISVSFNDVKPTTITNSGTMTYIEFVNVAFDDNGSGVSYDMKVDIGGSPFYIHDIHLYKLGGSKYNTNAQIDVSSVNLDYFTNNNFTISFTDKSGNAIIHNGSPVSQPGSVQGTIFSPPGSIRYNPPTSTSVTIYLESFTHISVNADNRYYANIEYLNISNSDTKHHVVDNWSTITPGITVPNLIPNTNYRISLIDFKHYYSSGINLSIDFDTPTALVDISTASDNVRSFINSTELNSTTQLFDRATISTTMYGNHGSIQTMTIQNYQFTTDSSADSKEYDMSVFFNGDEFTTMTKSDVHTFRTQGTLVLDLKDELIQIPYFEQANVELRYINTTDGDIQVMNSVAIYDVVIDRFTVDQGPAIPSPTIQSVIPSVETAIVYLAGAHLPLGNDVTDMYYANIELIVYGASTYEPNVNTFDAMTISGTGISLTNLIPNHGYNLRLNSFQHYLSNAINNSIEFASTAGTIPMTTQPDNVRSSINGVNTHGNTHEFELSISGDDAFIANVTIPSYMFITEAQTKTYNLTIDVLDVSSTMYVYTETFADIHNHKDNDPLILDTLSTSIPYFQQYSFEFKYHNTTDDVAVTYDNNIFNVVTEVANIDLPNGFPFPFAIQNVQFDSAINQINATITFTNPGIPITDWYSFTVVARLEDSNEDGVQNLQANTGALLAQTSVQLTPSNEGNHTIYITNFKHYRSDKSTESSVNFDPPVSTGYGSVNVGLVSYSRDSVVTSGILNNEGDTHSIVFKNFTFSHDSEILDMRILFTGGQSDYSNVHEVQNTDISFDVSSYGIKHFGSTDLTVQFVKSNGEYKTDLDGNPIVFPENNVTASSLLAPPNLLVADSNTASSLTFSLNGFTHESNIDDMYYANIEYKNIYNNDTKHHVVNNWSTSTPGITVPNLIPNTNYRISLIDFKHYYSSGINLSIDFDTPTLTAFVDTSTASDDVRSFINSTELNSTTQLFERSVISTTFDGDDGYIKTMTIQNYQFTTDSSADSKEYDMSVFFNGDEFTTMTKSDVHTYRTTGNVELNLQTESLQIPYFQQNNVELQYINTTDGNIPVTTDTGLSNVVIDRFTVDRGPAIPSPTIQSVTPSEDAITVTLQSTGFPMAELSNNYFANIGYKKTSDTNYIYSEDKGSFASVGPFVFSSLIPFTLYDIDYPTFSHVRSDNTLNSVIEFATPVSPASPIRTLTDDVSSTHSSNTTSLLNENGYIGNIDLANFNFYTSANSKAYDVYATIVNDLLTINRQVNVHSAGGTSPTSTNPLRFVIDDLNYFEQTTLSFQYINTTDSTGSEIIYGKNISGNDKIESFTIPAGSLLQNPVQFMSSSKTALTVSFSGLQPNQQDSRLNSITYTPTFDFNVVLMQGSTEVGNIEFNNKRSTDTISDVFSSLSPGTSYTVYVVDFAQSTPTGLRFEPTKQLFSITTAQFPGPDSLVNVSSNIDSISIRFGGTANVEAVNYSHPSSLSVSYVVEMEDPASSGTYITPYTHISSNHFGPFNISNYGNYFTSSQFLFNNLFPNTNYRFELQSITPNFTIATPKPTVVIQTASDNVTYTVSSVTAKIKDDYGYMKVIIVPDQFSKNSTYNYELEYALTGVSGSARFIPTNGTVYDPGSVSYFFNGSFPAYTLEIKVRNTSFDGKPYVNNPTINGNTLRHQDPQFNISTTISSIDFDGNNLKLYFAGSGNHNFITDSTPSVLDYTPEDLYRLRFTLNGPS
jgi:hypothetical protein